MYKINFLIRSKKNICMGKRNYDTSETLKTLGYLFVDCPFLNDGALSCDVLMEESYPKDDNYCI